MLFGGSGGTRALAANEGGVVAFQLNQVLPALRDELADCLATFAPRTSELIEGLIALLQGL